MSILSITWFVTVIEREWHVRGYTCLAARFRSCKAAVGSRDSASTEKSSDASDRLSTTSSSFNEALRQENHSQARGHTTPRFHIHVLQPGSLPSLLLESRCFCFDPTTTKLRHCCRHELLRRLRLHVHVCTNHSHLQGLKYNDHWLSIRSLHLVHESDGASYDRAHWSSLK